VSISSDDKTDPTELDGADDSQRDSDVHMSIEDDVDAPDGVDLDGAVDMEGTVKMRKMKKRKMGRSRSRWMRIRRRIMAKNLRRLARERWLKHWLRMLIQW
jgi:hypothetical protein